MYEDMLEKILGFLVMYIFMPLIIIITISGIVAGAYYGIKYLVQGDYHTIELTENDWDCTNYYRYWSSGSKGMSSGYRAVCIQYTMKNK